MLPPNFEGATPTFFIFSNHLPEHTIWGSLPTETPFGALVGTA